MTSLEEKLREAAERGLTHLSLSFAGTGGWTAIATPSTGHHYVSAFDKDPLVALAKALEDLPKARRRATTKITATVKADEPPQQEG